jgi:hypothetical protein
MLLAEVKAVLDVLVPHSWRDPNALKRMENVFEIMRVIRERSGESLLETPYPKNLFHGYDA